MPSAEKSTTAVEPAPPNESRSVENQPRDEKSSENEKSTPQNSIQQVISIISNKTRNLEKRKNKLDGYIKEEQDGKELSSEQEKAVSKYDEVVQQLSLSKEFFKQFQAIATAASRDAKRDARKMMFTRQMQETTKVRDILMIQDLLQRLKVDKVRSDFLNQRNGACPVTRAEMDFIDKFAQHVVPSRPNFSNEPSFENAAKTSAEHFSNLIDGRNRQFLDTGLTYEKARELLTRIQSCGYWEKDVKIVEVTEESRQENNTPNTDDLEIKESTPTPLPVAPAPTQVPTFNGNVNMMQAPQQQHQQQQQMMARMNHHQQQQQQQQQSKPLPEATNAPMKTIMAVETVENAYFKQKFPQPHQGQMLANGMPVVAPQNEFAAANFSFLQDSELDAPAPGSQQQKMPVNVIQPQQPPQQQPSQNLRNAASFQRQSPLTTAGQMYPPGLAAPQQQHIPVNYQASPQQQQNTVPSQVPPHMIPKQQQAPVNGNQMTGYGTQTPPMTQPSRSAYPTIVESSQQHYQQKPQNLQVDQKQQQQVKMDGDAGGLKKQQQQREEYQQEPQIDTWKNETAQTGQSGGSSNYRSSGGSGFNRSNNRSSTGTGGGDRERGDRGGKYNNQRSSQQSRNYENGSGESPREATGASSGGTSTFFRNNENYNRSAGGGNRYENRGGNFKPRGDGRGEYRAGSVRFSGSASAQGSSNPGQRK